MIEKLQPEDRRRLLHEKIVERSERYNEEIKGAALIREMMKHEGWPLFEAKIQKIDDEFAKVDVADIRDENDLRIRQGAHIAGQMILGLSVLIQNKAKLEMLDEAKAVAMFGDTVIDEVEDLQSESQDPELTLDREPGPIN